MAGSGWMRWLGARGLLGVAVASRAAAQSGAPSREEDRGRIVARIDSIVNARLATGATAGLSVGVVKAGELLLARGYGYADLEHSVPATAETVYQLGSLTKQFTALAILQLAERGKLSLDDDLTKYLPGYPTGGRRITIAQLLNHTSGLKNYTA